MEYKINNSNKIIIFCSGEINSSNASTFENDIHDILNNNDGKFDSLELDFSKVYYISSAGLRVMLKLSQSYNNFQITNTSLEVYEIFKMTGFTNLINVSKAMLNVDISNAKIIGEGFFSTVYRLDGDTIIKVFKNDTSIENVNRELNLAKQAFILGIPTAISFDVVKVNDKLGVRFEMLDCASLRDVMINKDTNFDDACKKYANLLKTINTTKTNDKSLPDINKISKEKLVMLKDYLPLDAYNKLSKMINDIPDRNTFVHGDCHFKNIMVQGDDLLLIDMDTLSKGHPIFELAAIYSSYIAFEEDDPGNTLVFLGAPFDLVKRMFNKVLEYYLPVFNDDIYNKIAIVSYTHMIWWTLINQKENTKRINGNVNRLLSLLPLYDNLDIGV